MSRIIPSRYSSRNTDELDKVLQVLNETLFCTISYAHNNQPYALPTGFCVMDNQLIIHGSVKSHFLDMIIKVQEVCITTLLFDGLVLASSAFEHSVNYRSTVMFSSAREIIDHDEKYAAFQAFTEKYIPGRWDELRPMTKAEMDATRVISFLVEEASLKQRTGPPSAKSDDWMEKVWIGEIPAKTSYLPPIQSEKQKPLDKLPDHIEQLISQH